MDEDYVMPWKNGDILVIRNWIIIFFGLKPENNAIIYHALCNLRDINNPSPYTVLGRGVGIGYYNEQYEDESFRYATNYEKRKFFDKLAERGGYWDSNTLQLRDKNGLPIRDRNDDLPQ